MQYLNQKIENELKNQGAELIRFVNISHLDEKQNRQLPTAIVFALPLTAEYVKTVFNIPDYVQARIADNYNFDDDEYSQTEHKAGEIADELARFITGKGYKAVSQSDTGLLADGVFDYDTRTCRYCTRDTGMGITADTLFLRPRSKSTETLKHNRTILFHCFC